MLCLSIAASPASAGALRGFETARKGPRKSVRAPSWAAVSGIALFTAAIAIGSVMTAIGKTESDETLAAQALANAIDPRKLGNEMLEKIREYAKFAGLEADGLPTSINILAVSPHSRHAFVARIEMIDNVGGHYELSAFASVNEGLLRFKPYRDPLSQPELDDMVERSEIPAEEVRK